MSGAETIRRVLHLENTGGVAWQIAVAQREAGMTADVLLTHRPSFDHPHDLKNLYGGGRVRTLTRMAKTLRIARKYDLLHVHGGLRRGRLDVLAMRRFLGIPVVVHYHGSETRLGYGMAYEDHVDAKIVATPDLLVQHRHAHFHPTPYGARPMYTPHEGPIRLVHLPSNRAMKGSAMFLAAIERLRDEGESVHFDLVEGVDHAKALAAIDAADVVLDQFVPPEVATHGRPLGLFGMVSLEAMARGRVAVAALRPDIEVFYPGCPVLSAGDLEGLVGLLRRCIRNPSSTRELGLRGIDYVHHRHHPAAYVRFLDGVYAAAVLHRNC